MKSNKLHVFIISLFWACGFCAADRYVSSDSPEPGEPYTNWYTAAHAVSLAVNLANSANAGETVWISNGTHAVTDLQVGNTIVRGWSGNPEDVTLDAGGVTRAVDLRNSNAQLLDITVCNGNADRGGGVRYDSCDALVSNCIVRNNYASNVGGGLYIGYGRLVDSRIYSNTVNSSLNGGAGVAASGGMISSCVIFHNTAVHSGGYAGGVAMMGASKLFNSMVVSNQAPWMGGIYLHGASSLVENCIVGWNTASSKNSGGICMLGTGARVRNSLIVGNQSIASNGGGIYLLGSDGIVESSTIVGNQAAENGGGIYVRGYPNNRIYNCIIYDNTGPADWENIGLRWDGQGGMPKYFHYTCSPCKMTDGQGNITDAPGFVNALSGNYRLAAGSPCINAGTNGSWMADACDLDGHPRLDRFNHKTDMGCYEYIPRGMLILVQ